jgi:hypothetical protein
MTVSAKLAGRLASFYPLLEDSTFLILTHSCQNEHRLTSQTICLDHRTSSQPFSDASEQVKAADGEIGEMSAMWNFFAAEADHRVNSDT